MKVERDISSLTREQARSIDKQAIDDFGIPDILLMENAGRSISDFLLAETPSVPMLVVCGKGNNGGDGIVAARHLLFSTPYGPFQPQHNWTTPTAP